LSFSFQRIRGWGIRPGARFRVIHEAGRGCNRAAILQPVAEYLPGCKQIGTPKLLSHRPVFRSIKAFCTGLPGWMNCRRMLKPGATIVLESPRVS